MEVDQMGTHNHSISVENAIDQILSDDKNWPGDQSRSKVKRFPYPLRELSDHHLSFHAKKRMAERSLSREDICLILRFGRALIFSDAIFIFLCPGEIPKSKAFKKQFERLQGATLLIALDQPVLITVLPDWTKWKKLIFPRTRPISSRKARRASRLDEPWYQQFKSH
jgi:hypothetical protein